MISIIKERGALLLLLVVLVFPAGCTSQEAEPDECFWPRADSRPVQAGKASGGFSELTIYEKYPSLLLARRDGNETARAGLISAEGDALAYPPDIDKDKSFWEASRKFDYVFSRRQPERRPILHDLFTEIGHRTFKDIAQLKSRRCLITLGLGAALAGASRTADHDIAEHFSDRHMIGGLEDVGEWLGHPAAHIVFAGSMYFLSRMRNDAATQERGLILIEGLTLTHISTGLLKLAFNRERPDGDDFGFPSGHVASTFALASMLDEMYGHKVGYPMYLLGGFVAYSRMSGDKHYLSDAVFGAFLGYAIGKAVFRGNEMRLFGMEVEPYLDERSGAAGIALTLRF